jgi:hypothetical protein
MVEIKQIFLLVSLFVQFHNNKRHDHLWVIRVELPVVDILHKLDPLDHMMLVEDFHNILHRYQLVAVVDKDLQ